jgi:hypothetical protein
MTADEKYQLAMRESDVLLADIREAEKTSDPIRAMMASLWAHRRNIPFATTIHESIEEMRSPLEQRRFAT